MTTPQEIRDAAVRYFGGRQEPFTQAELAAFLKVSRFTLLRYRQEGALKAFIRGSVVRYPVEAVYEFLMRQTV